MWGSENDSVAVRYFGIILQYFCQIIRSAAIALAIVAVGFCLLGILFRTLTQPGGENHLVIINDSDSPLGPFNLSIEQSWWWDWHATSAFCRAHEMTAVALPTPFPSEELSLEGDSLPDKTLTIRLDTGRANRTVVLFRAHDGGIEVTTRRIPLGLRRDPLEDVNHPGD